MLRNLIRSLVIRSLITIGLNLSRGQLLKRNSSINRLLSIINLDINRGEALRRIRLKISRTSTQNSLTVLGHQLRIQVVVLTINQTLIGHSVSNNRTIDNTRRTLSKLSLSLNRRRLSGRVRTTSSIFWQSRLIWGKYTLAIWLTVQVAVWTNNRDIRIWRVLWNFYVWILFKCFIRKHLLRINYF